MQNFSFRGLEIHSSRMWQWDSILRTLDFMRKTGLNALILHQNDILDEIVMPSVYFHDQELVWKRWPVRRSKTYANAVYLSQIIKRAKSFGIDVYLEVKEIWYPEAILELFPELRDSHGVICPTNPFWFSFLEAKTREAIDILPDLAGIIVSPATRESKVSISTRTCACDRCQRTSGEEWYRQYIKAIFTPLAEKQKTLVVRDFSYTADQQDALINAVKSCSDQIVLALKNVPHDFWPTFPTNERIGQTPELREWIEFDVWGQYCGIGLFPCSLAEDLQKRILYCLQKGAVGAIFRTDWEICNDASNFNSFNMLNLFAAAMLSSRPDTHLDSVYQAWAEYGLSSPFHTESEAMEPVVPQNANAWKNLKNFMKESWNIIEKTLYVHGNVFQLSSKIQYTVDDIYYTMTKHHSKSDWEKGSDDILTLTIENVHKIFKEKEEAMSQVKSLPAILSPETLGVPDDFLQEIYLMLELFESYVEMFYHAAKITFLFKSYHDIRDIPALEQANREMEEFRIRLEAQLSGTHYPYYVYWLLDTRMLQSFVEDNEQRMLPLRE